MYPHPPHKRYCVCECPVGGGRMATYTLCRLITTDYLYNTM